MRNRKLEISVEEMRRLLTGNDPEESEDNNQQPVPKFDQDKSLPARLDEQRDDGN